MNGEDVEISMPVSDANAVLMGIDADGAAQTFEPVSYDNGVAVYRLPALMQVFAVQTNQEDPTEKPTEQPAEETTAPTEQPTDPTEKATETPTERATDANSSTKDSVTGGTSNTSSTVTGGTTTGGTSASGDAVQTGASSAAIIALIILAMSALIIGTFVSKRRKGE
ncbi:MAG: LPXTG cell wall anchor domain-containing protein [Ruminococcus sp.]|nr:LPXTG cell wall anchor domain-containing protein [Ruminococcus sp.]